VDNNHLNDVRGMVHDFMGAAKEGLKEIQGGPIGMTPRSKREMSIMMKKLQDLPPEVRQAKMEEMANVAGHKGNGPDDCSLCDFVKSQMK